MPNQNKIKFEPRVRFNWGFHDGTAAAERQDPRDVSHHYDPTYAAGYEAGLASYKELGYRLESSEPAWQAHIAAQGAPA